jgi:hypothetical protein
MRHRTRTFDYVWRSFVAGGLAGCVVSFKSPMAAARLPLSYPPQM